MVKKKTLGTERPKNWCYLRKGKYSNLWIIELPAALRTIMYCNGYESEGDEIQHLRLSMPRTLWFFIVVNGAVNRAKVAAIKRPFSVKRMDTLAYCTALPNTDYDGHLCTGDAFDYDQSEKETEVQMLDRFMKYLLYESIWNEELEHHTEVMSDLDLLDMENWAAESRGKNGAKYGQKMFPAGHEIGTVGAMASAMFKNTEGGD
jgi:hypothetical protein